MCLYVFVTVSSQVGSNRVDPRSASQENSEDDHEGSFIFFLLFFLYRIESAIVRVRLSGWKLNLGLWLPSIKFKMYICNILLVVSYLLILQVCLC